MKEYSVVVSMNFSEEDVLDIISSAIYDIGYWACIDNTTDDWEEVSGSLPEDHTFEDVFYNLLKNGKCVVLEDVEGTEGPWELTLDKLLNGIKLAVQNGHWNGNIDEIDGLIGDIIFQYGLFNEVIFG